MERKDDGQNRHALTIPRVAFNTTSRLAKSTNGIYQQGFAKNQHLNQLIHLLFALGVIALGA